MISEEHMFCRNCGTPTDEGAQFCTRCGADLKATPEAVTDVPPPPEFQEYVPPAGTTVPPPPPPPGAAPYTAPSGVQPKQKLVAALLGFFLGWLGVHRFYLGYNTIGVAQLVLGIAGMFTCGVTTIAAWIWGIVDGVLILTGSLSTDAQGVPLRD